MVARRAMRSVVSGSFFPQCVVLGWLWLRAGSSLWLRSLRETCWYACGLIVDRVGKGVRDEKEE